jgi:enoyl-CoA hydratase/carnithine racemase
MTWLLPQIAGTQRSMDLMLFGAPLEGADLVAAGIAPELIGLQSFSATVKQKIESLLALPAESLERYKRQRIALAGDDLNRALDLEEKVLVEVTTKLVLSQSTPSLIKS